MKRCLCLARECAVPPMNLVQPLVRSYITAEEYIVRNKGTSATHVYKLGAYDEGLQPFGFEGGRAEDC